MDHLSISDATNGKQSGDPLLRRNGSQKMPKKCAKRAVRYFDNDLNVQRFLGIFSAHYCWPQDCEEGSRDKCWSQVMIASNEWFMARLWPQVVSKVPKITADDRTLHQINELLFALVLKECDLLTAQQMQYFEAVIDVFNNELTFGVLFWLKICSQFNWRLIYAKLIADHKHCKRVLEVLCEELESEDVYRCMNGQEVDYLYSLVDCVCVHAIAHNIVNDKSHKNVYFVDVMKRFDDRVVYGSDYRPLMRQLATFNVLTQELIGFGFALMSSDDHKCQEMIRNKVRELEKLLDERVNDIDANVEPMDKRVAEDVAHMKANMLSLELINKQYFQKNGVTLQLQPLQKFFEKITDKSGVKDIDIHSFFYFSCILNDRLHANYCQLLQLLIGFADSRHYEKLMARIRPEDVVINGLLTALAHRVYSDVDDSGRICFQKLLYSSLSASREIDLKKRVQDFGLKAICGHNSLAIKTLFNQLVDNDTITLDKLIHEIIIGAYIDGRKTLEQLMAVAFDQSLVHQQVVAKVLVNELHALSSMEMYGHPVLYQLILHRIMDQSSLEMINQMTKLIELIVNEPQREDMSPVVSVETLFQYLICDNKFTKQEVVFSKLVLLKNLVNMTDGEWPTIQANPVPIIAYLMQYMDYFWRSPVRKELFVEFLDDFLKKKLNRELTEEEFHDLDDMLRDLFGSRMQASHHRIYLMYCERVFPKPVHELYNIRTDIYHDQILHYAIATHSHQWISAVYQPELYITYEKDIKTALAHILPALTAREWFKLFDWLMLYYYTFQVMTMFRTAISNTKESVDKNPLVDCYLKLAADVVVDRHELAAIQRPMNEKDIHLYELDLAIMFKALSTVEFLFVSAELRARLVVILTELATTIRTEGFRLPSRYWDDKRQIPYIVKEVVNQVFPPDYRKEDMEDSVDVHKTLLIPAGSQRINAMKALNSLSDSNE